MTETPQNSQPVTTTSGQPIDTNTGQTVDTPQIPNTIDQVSPEQWQAFVGQLNEQNNALQTALAQTRGQLNQVTSQQTQERVNQMTPEEQAAHYKAQLEGIQQAGQQIQAQEVSNTVWQRRDADAAARILQSHGLKGDEPELYRAAWDVNWMPRFAASVDQIVRTRQANGRNGNNAANNAANRANVGTSTSSNLPEIDPNASGFDTIRFALSRQKQ